MRYLTIIICCIALGFTKKGAAQKLYVSADTVFQMQPVKFRDSVVMKPLRHVRYGLKRNNDWVFKPEYKSIAVYPNCFILQKNVLLKREARDIYVFVDSTGKQKAEYNFYKFSGDKFIVFKGGRKALRYKTWEGGKRGLLDGSGNQLQAPEFDNILQHINGGFITILGGSSDEFSEGISAAKYGLLSEDGKTIFAPEYDYISGAAPNETNSSSKYNAIKINRGGKWVRTQTGWKVIGGKWGLLDRNYKLLAQAEYALASRLPNAYILVNKAGTQKLSPPDLGVPWESYIEGGLWGLLDSNGSIKVPIVYTYLRTREQASGKMFKGILVASKEPRMHYHYGYPQNINLGLVNYEGQELTPFVYSELDLSSTYQGKIRACKGGKAEAPFWTLENGKWGFLDSSGKELTKFEYEAIHSESGHPTIQYAQIGPTGKRMWGLMNHKLQHITVAGFAEMQSAGSYYMVKSSENKWGLISLNGQEITELKYQSIRSIDSLYLIVENKGCNILRRDGKEMFDEWTDVSTCFNQDGYLIKEKNGKWGVINHLGDTAAAFQFEEIKEIEHRSKWVLVKSGGKWGIYDLSQKKMSLPAEYDALSVKLAGGKKFPFPYLHLDAKKDGKKVRLCESVSGFETL